jgi:hypothetical protein
LRQIVDDRYTASVLLGLSQTFQNSMGENHNILSSANVCNAMDSCPNTASNNARRLTAASPLLGREPDSSVPHDNTDENSKQNGITKRVRRRGKYTPQERERIRLNLFEIFLSSYPYQGKRASKILFCLSSELNDHILLTRLQEREEQDACQAYTRQKEEAARRLGDYNKPDGARIPFVERVLRVP